MMTPNQCMQLFYPSKVNPARRGKPWTTSLKCIEKLGKMNPDDQHGLWMVAEYYAVILGVCRLSVRLLFEFLILCVDCS
jgi:hypothetical protein